jgi:hypothetical protein
MIRPPFAVIPTFVIVGPFALLATLSPAIFGGLALLLRRWRLFFFVSSLGSLVYVGHSWFHGYINDSWLGEPAVPWCTMALIALAGVYWSGRRQPNSTEDAANPRRGERVVLWSVSLIGLGVMAWTIRKGLVLSPPWRDFLVIWTVAWAGTLYSVGLSLIRKRQRTPAVPSTERVMLAALTIACAVSGGSLLLGGF